MALNAPVTDVDPLKVLKEAGWSEPSEITRFEGGWDTIIWRFTSADGRYHGLRLYRPDENRDVEGAFRREKLSLEVLARGGIPCPEIEATGKYEDMPFFVLSWIPGRNLITVLEKEPWKLWGLGRKFGELQARLHQLDCPDDLAFQSEDEWIETADDVQIQAAMRGRVQSSGFCHFDFHPVNVMCDGRDLVGVLDFSFSGKADIRADLGRTKALLAAAPIPPSPKKPVLQYLRGQFFKCWEKGYREAAGGMPLEPIFEAWGGSTFLGNIMEAVADGRGWGTAKDIEKMRQYVEDRKRAAGIVPSA